MPTSKAGTWNKAGFTLIELAVVVFLLGLMAVIATPLLSGPLEDGPSHSARRLAGTVKHLFNEAALSGREYRLVFNLDQASYAAVVLDGTGELRPVTGVGASTQLRGETRFADIRVAGQGRFTQGEVTTPIYPAGWLPETVIHLNAGNGKVLTLRLLSFTGTCEIYEGYRDF